MKCEGLEVGYEFPPVSYKLTPSIVSKYEEAVENLPVFANLVPPMAIAAYTMKALSQFLDVPPGSIHVSQEVEFFKPVAVGSSIYCRSRILQRSNRNKLNMLVIGLTSLDQNNELVLSGKMTFILPN